MAMRMTGLISGMDTESLVSQLMAAHQTKVNDIKKSKQLVEWKTEAWQSLNTKIYNFYNSQVSTLRTNGSYNTKKVTASDSEAVSVTAGNNVSKGSHTVSVSQLASSAYLTGGIITDSNSTFNATAVANKTTSFEDMVDTNGDSLGLGGKEITISYDLGAGAIDTTFTLGGSEANSVANLNELNDKLSQDVNLKDLKAEYDSTGKIIFTNSSVLDDGSGNFAKGLDFTITATDLGFDSTVLGAKELETDANTTVAGTVEMNYEYSFTSSQIKGTTKLADLGVAAGTSFIINGKEFAVESSTTLDGLASGLSKLGVNANYDSKQGRFYINSSGTGETNNFTISGDSDALTKLGLSDTLATKIDAKDAIIKYNNVEYKSASNVFSINDMTITAQKETAVDSPVTLTVEADTDGVYNQIKNFVKGYNEVIDEMNKLYNQGKPTYEPLTDDEKAEMSEDQITKWEDLAKKGLLRRDNTISTLLSSMRSILNKSISVTNDDGTTSKYSLASLGIVTGDYSENGKLHILGDEDDSLYADQENKLKAFINDKSSYLDDIFAGTKEKPGFGYQLYDKLTTSMKKVTGVSSSLSFYSDLTYKDQISEYDEKVKTLQEKFSKIEDRYYSQFAAMESAMAEMQSQQSYLSQLGLGS